MRIIAHRSGPTVYPEQTIASARLAMENHADMIEIDVRFTRDRKIAVTHDQNVSRVFGVDKNVSEMTETEFLSLRHTENRSYSSHLLEDYLLCGISPLLIHIKESEIIGELLKCLDRHGYADKVVLGVESANIVPIIKSHNPDIKILAFMPSPADTAEFAKAGVDYIRLWEGSLTEENINEVRKYDAELWVMSGGTEGFDVGVTSKESLCRMIELNVDGILINDITVLKEVL